MAVVCLVDQSTHATVDDLHGHLKKIKVAQARYYYQYYPKKDLLTGEQIEFKNASQYLSTDFANKNNLKRWIKENPEKGKEWAIDWLKKRKEQKNLEYAPCQAELRSLCCPSMPYYDSIGGYYEITSRLGFKQRYSNQKPVLSVDISHSTIIQDTREQTPLKLPVKTVVAKLDYGDYSLEGADNKGIYLERKSLNDFIGSLTSKQITRKKMEMDSPAKRLERELERAAIQGHYIIMLVESPINDALGFDYLPWMKYAKAKPSHIFKNLRDLLVKFPLSFQVVFANGRIDAAEKAVKIFQMGEQVRHIDLEYAAEKGEI